MKHHASKSSCIIFFFMCFLFVFILSFITMSDCMLKISLGELYCRTHNFSNNNLTCVRLFSIFFVCIYARARAHTYRFRKYYFSFKKNIFCKTYKKQTKISLLFTFEKRKRFLKNVRLGLESSKNGHVMCLVQPNMARIKIYVHCHFLLHLFFTLSNNVFKIPKHTHFTSFFFFFQ